MLLGELLFLHLPLNLNISRVSVLVPLDSVVLVFEVLSTTQLLMAILYSHPRFLSRVLGAYVQLSTLHCALMSHTCLKLKKKKKSNAKLCIT